VLGEEETKFPAKTAWSQRREMPSEFYPTLRRVNCFMPLSREFVGAKDGKESN